MCKAPKPPKPKEPKKPQFLRNQYLDEFVGDAQAVKSLKTGRSTLRVPLGAPSGVGGRQPGESLVPDTTLPDITPGVAPRPAPIAPRPRLQPGENLR